MDHRDFKVGEFFYTNKKNGEDAAKWKVTDIGTRVITAIYCNKPDEWLTGPPYMLQEIVFSPEDFGGCFPSEEERDKQLYGR